MNSHLKWILLAVWFGSFLGCGGPTLPAERGTKGTLKFGAEVTSDINVTVHRRDGSGLSLAGFGITTDDGSFVLFKPGAAEPLWLEPGDYVFTLESIGPPVRIPEEFQTAESTPLKVSWTATMKSVDLEAPHELITP